MEIVLIICLTIITIVCVICYCVFKLKNNITLEELINKINFVDRRLDVHYEAINKLMNNKFDRWFIMYDDILKSIKELNTLVQYNKEINK